MATAQQQKIDALVDEAVEAGAITVTTKVAGAFTPGVVAVIATRSDGIKVSSLVGENGGATEWDRHEPEEAV